MKKRNLELKFFNANIKIVTAVCYLLFVPINYALFRCVFFLFSFVEIHYFSFSTTIHAMANRIKNETNRKETKRVEQQTQTEQRTKQKEKKKTKNGKRIAQ